MSSASAAQQFYGRWATLYDLAARATPGIASLRERAVASLDLDPGDVVVDIGCGTGANVPYLRERVGREGLVVGVDFTDEMLSRARASAAENGWTNVEFVRGDATTLPIEDDRSVDAVFASFLSGMLASPADAVRGWIDRLAPGGRIALLDAAQSDRMAAWPANQLVKVVVFSSTPRKLRRWENAPWTVLDRRVAAAHRAVCERTVDCSRDEYLLGVVRVTAGRIGENA